MHADRQPANEAHRQRHGGGPLEDSLRFGQDVG
jgi:hypothetical protein